MQISSFYDSAHVVKEIVNKENVVCYLYGAKDDRSDVILSVELNQKYASFVATF